jgi:transposase
MLSFPAAIKVYLCTVACDMRRSFDGLSMMAEHVIRCNPFSGHLLVFCNRRSDRLKILYWDRNGWAIWYKRLEAGTFQFPFTETGRKEIATWELGLAAGGNRSEPGAAAQTLQPARDFRARAGKRASNRTTRAYLKASYPLTLGRGLAVLDRSDACSWKQPDVAPGRCWWASRPPPQPETVGNGP